MGANFLLTHSIIAAFGLNDISADVQKTKLKHFHITEHYLDYVTIYHLILIENK
jgi:hypothetical protein